MSSTSNTKKMSKTEEDKTNIQAFIFFLIALFVLNKLFNVPFNPVIAILTYLIGTKYMDKIENIFFLIALFMLNKLFNVPFNPVIAILTYLIRTKYMDNNKNIFFPAEIEEEYVIPPKQEKDD